MNETRKREMCKYEVSVVTSKVKGAGTDSAITLTMVCLEQKIRRRRKRKKERQRGKKRRKKRDRKEKKEEKKKRRRKGERKEE